MKLVMQIIQIIAYGSEFHLNAHLEVISNSPNYLFLNLHSRL
jgi:hypothetical protein